MSQLKKIWNSIGLKGGGAKETISMATGNNDVFAKAWATTANVRATTANARAAYAGAKAANTKTSNTNVLNSRFGSTWAVTTNFNNVISTGINNDKTDNNHGTIILDYHVKARINKDKTTNCKEISTNEESYEVEYDYIKENIL